MKHLQWVGKVIAVLCGVGFIFKVLPLCVYLLDGCHFQWCYNSFCSRYSRIVWFQSPFPNPFSTYWILNLSWVEVPGLVIICVALVRELPCPSTHYTNTSRHRQSMIHASYFAVPQSGKILSLISVLGVIWGNNLLSSNPITANFLPQEWLELKFHCSPEDFDTRTPAVCLPIFKGMSDACQCTGFQNPSTNCALRD